VSKLSLPCIHVPRFHNLVKLTHPTIETVNNARESGPIKKCYETLGVATKTSDACALFAHRKPLPCVSLLFDESVWMLRNRLTLFEKMRANALNVRVSVWNFLFLQDQEDL